MASKKRKMSNASDFEQVDMKAKQQALLDISTRNLERCNVPQVLDALEITVSTIPNINLYLFELIQNAVDAGASRISLQADTERVVFQHDAPGGLGDEVHHVRGMSNVFQSTKSVGSVGFMGFGFKTIYKRFQRVNVSDSCGWRFTFQVPERDITIIEDVVVQARSWLGAVTPQWDDSILPPSAPYTTRFELSLVTASTKGISIEADANDAFFSSSIGSEVQVAPVLPILATQGLTEMKISLCGNSQCYNLVNEANQVSVFCENNLISKWEVIVHTFTPSRGALKALCQARLKNILAVSNGNQGPGSGVCMTLDEVWSKINRQYRMYGLIQEGGKVARQPGQIFATLPINSRVPFGISIQADWLLDLSRTGLRDLDTNAWQRSMVLRIASVLGEYLRSIPTRAHSKTDIKSAYDLICPSGEISWDAYDMDFRYGEWIDELKQHLQSAPFLPIISSDPSPAFRGVGNVYVLPQSRSSLPKQAAALLRRFILDRECVNNNVVTLLQQLDLVKPLNLDDLLSEWKNNGLQDWWKNIQTVLLTDAERFDALFEFWAFLVDIFGDPARDIPCVPTQNGNWVRPRDVSVLDHQGNVLDYPQPGDPCGDVTANFLAAHLTKTVGLLDGVLPHLLVRARDWDSIGRKALDWINCSWNKLDLRKILDTAMTSSSYSDPRIFFDGCLGATAWSIFKGAGDAVSYAVTKISSGERSIQSIQESVLSSPYVSDAKLAAARVAIFANLPVIDSAYAHLVPQMDPSSWYKFFDNKHALGVVRFSPKEIERLGVWPSYSAVKDKVAAMLHVSSDKMKDVDTSSKTGWIVYDMEFFNSDIFHRGEEVAPHLAPWLEFSIDEIRKREGGLYAQGEVWRIYQCDGKAGTAKWVKFLQHTAWLPSLRSPILRQPLEVRIDDAALSPALRELLHQKGLQFANSKTIDKREDITVVESTIADDTHAKKTARFRRLSALLSSACRAPLILTLRRTARTATRVDDVVFALEGAALRSLRDQATEIMAQSYDLSAVYNVAPLSETVKCVFDTATDDSDFEASLAHLASKL